MSQIARLKKQDAFVLLAVLLAFVGFAPTFYLKPIFGAGKPLTLLVLTHGIVITAWIALFVHQYFSAGQGSTARHKLVGVSGAVIFGLFITLSVVTVVVRVASGRGSSTLPPLLSLAYPFWVIFETFIFGAVAFALVRRPEWHRQFQLAGFFTLIAPGTARALRFIDLGGATVTYGSLLISLLLYIGAAQSRTGQDGKPSKALLTAIAIQFVTAGLLFLSLQGAPLWFQFASALTGYPL